MRAAAADRINNDCVSAPAPAMSEDNRRAADDAVRPPRPQG